MKDINQKIVDGLGRRERQVYKTVKAMDYANIRQIARHMRVDKSSVTGRLSTLRDLGIIKFAFKAVDTVTGITVHFWETKKRRWL